MRTARLTTIGFVACAFGAAAGAHAQVTTSAASPARAAFSDSAILAIIKQRVDEKRSAGIVVGLIDADGKSHVVAFGDPGPGQPRLDGNSVFEIGSISKVFTSAVLAEMVQAGEVHLDDPAQRYLPASVHLPSRDGKVITLANLSEQNSGLPRMPTNFHPRDTANPYAELPRSRCRIFSITTSSRRRPSGSSSS